MQIDSLRDHHSNGGQVYEALPALFPADGVEYQPRRVALHQNPQLRIMTVEPWQKGHEPHRVTANY